MRTRTLYIDTGASLATNILLQPGSPFPLSTRPVFVQGDHFTLRLAFMEVEPPETEGDTPTVNFLTLPTDDQIVIAGKPGPNIIYGDKFFKSEGFTKVTEGEGENEKVYYEALCNLHTEQIRKWFNEQKTRQVEVEVDVEVQNQGNTERITYRFVVILYSEAYTGGNPPVDADPPYPPASSLITVAQAEIAPGWKLVVDETGVHAQPINEE